MNKKDSKQKQIEDLKAGWQRTQADFENYKKRVEQEKALWRDQARSETFAQLLPLLDNISLATNHLPEKISSEPWVQGIVHIGRQIDQQLGELGITKIQAKAKDAFDHNIHEAIETRQDKSYNDGEIIEIISDGYLNGQKVIRPARVIVCKNE
ncbi:MAG: heat shock protein GrpE [candidate division WS2 bacterium ADurb.Bin280]|uniref:Protein GrpE n=1 Tax=candidate division WS2 bacterium ADurb.Bin280 TaxID=1852829 RepID=A0A1V5SDY5_9BACT|nr:MAG: heat shock protein GrpE [candidate division WS2 bacterium ADurb.Bin280]